MQLDKVSSTLTQPSRKLRAAYTLAAGAAASVAVQDADAAVVYSGLQNISVTQFNSQNLNLDGDAFADIKLKNYVFGGGNYQGATVNFAPGKLVGFTAGNNYVTALTAGQSIDGSTLGPSFFGSLAYGASNPNAQFNNATDAYIGLSFPAGGNTYYGWVRVDVNNAAGTFVIKDWAYENVPDAGILAGAGQVPEPATLGLLACGAAGIAAMRRQRSAA